MDINLPKIYQCCERIGTDEYRDCNLYFLREKMKSYIERLFKVRLDTKISLVRNSSTIM